MARCFLLSHIPWKVCGAFYGHISGDETIPRRIMNERIAEYDEAVAVGKSLHRVSRRLLAPGSLFRTSASAWLSSSNRLWVFIQFGRIAKFMCLKFVV